MANNQNSVNARFFRTVLCLQIWFQRLELFHFSSSYICSKHNFSPWVRLPLPTLAAVLDRCSIVLESFTSWEFHFISNCVFTNNLSWPLFGDSTLLQSVRHKLFSMSSSNFSKLFFIPSKWVPFRESKRHSSLS